MPEPAPLTDAAVLFADAWKRFRARFWLLMGLMGASTAACILLFFVGILAFGFSYQSGLAGMAGFFAVVTVVVGAALWIMTWGQVAACDAALSPDDAVPTFADCARAAWPKIMNFSWVCALYLLVVGGGSLLFFLPGVYLAVALIFAPLICLEEGVTGVEALTRSMQYTRGRWLPLFGRLLLLALLTALPGAVPLIGPILGPLVSPLPLVALVLLYRQSRSSFDETAQPSWPLALAAAAWLLPIGATAVAMPGMIAAWPEIRAQAENLANMDPQDAQKLLQAIQAGKSGPETALLAAQLLNKKGDASVVASVELSTAAPEGELGRPPVASEDAGR